MLKDDFLIKQLRQLLEQVFQAVGLLDKGDLVAAHEQAEMVCDAVVGPCGPDWERLTTATLMTMVGKPERSRALARALWILASVAENEGRLDEARTRGRRAMELYAKVRLGPDEVDIRAARELAAASGRLRAP